MSFDELQECCDVIGYGNEKKSAILNLYVVLMPPIKFFLLIWYMVLEEMSFEDFKDCCHGGHFGHWKETIGAVLNHHVASMLPNKFQSN